MSEQLREAVLEFILQQRKGKTIYLVDLKSFLAKQGMEMNDLEIVKTMISFCEAGKHVDLGIEKGHDVYFTRI